MKIGCMLYYFLNVRAYVLKTVLFLALSLSIYLFVRSLVLFFLLPYKRNRENKISRWHSLSIIFTREKKRKPRLNQNRMNSFSILFTLIVYLLGEIQGKILNEYVNANIVSRQKNSLFLFNFRQ